MYKMPGRRRKQQVKFLTGLLFIPLILLIDQFCKTAVMNKLSAGESVPVINDVFHITFVKNTGTFFGLLKGYNTFFILFAGAALISIAVFIFEERKNFPVFISLSLIFSGALGNLIDRIFRGNVIDFIDFRIWPVFNFADMSITFGTILLGIALLKKTADKIT